MNPAIEEKLQKLKENKKLIVIVIGISALGAIYISGLNSNSSTNTNNSLNNNKNLSIENKTMDATSVSKDENVYLLIKNLEKQLLDLKNNSLEFTKENSEFTKKKIEAIIELSKLTWTGDVTLLDSSSLTKGKGDQTTVNSITIKYLNENTSTLENIVPISIDQGYLIQLNEQALDYFVFQKETAEQTEIFEISINGLKKIYDNVKRQNVLNMIKDEGKDNQSNIFIKKYIKTILLLSTTNGAIVQELQFKELEVKGIQDKKYKNAKLKKDLVGVIYKDYTTLKVNNFKPIASNGEKFGEDGKYNLEYIEYVQEPEKTIATKILLKRNNYIYKEIDLEYVESLLMLTYEKDGKKYIYKDNKLIEVNDNGIEVLDLGKGIIKGSIDKTTKKLDNTALVVEKFEVIQEGLKNYIGMILKGQKDSYEVTKNNIKVIGIDKTYDLENILIDSNGVLVFKNGNYLDKISEVKKTKKTGVEVTSDKYKIRISDDEVTKVFDRTNNNNEILTNKKLKAVFDYKRDEVTIYSAPIINLDKKRQIINDESYDQFEEKNKVLYFYKKGTIIQEIDKTPKKEFTTKVDNISLIDGNSFNYQYILDKNTGKITSDEIGDLIIKYTKETAPFEVLKGNIKTSIIKQTKEKRDVIEDTISIEELFLKNNYLKYLEFVTTDGISIKVSSPNSLNYNGIMLSSDYIYYQVDKKIIEIKLKQISREQKEKLGLDGTELEEYHLFFNIDKIKNSNPNYFDIKNKAYVFENKKNEPKVMRYLNKTNSSQIYKNIFEEEVDIKKNTMNIITKDEKVYNLNLNNLKALNQYQINDLKKIYSETLDGELKKINNEPEIVITEKDKQILEAKKIIDKKTNELSILENKYVKKTLNFFRDKLDIKPEDENEIKKANIEEDTFTFEIGTVLKYDIPTRMEVTEDGELKMQVKLKNSSFKDLNGNFLTMINPKVVIRVTADKNLRKLYPKPIKLIYLDSSTNKKRTIAIPESSVKITFKEDKNDKYGTDGVLAYVIDPKVRGLGTKITLSTISQIIKNMTSGSTASSLTDMTSALTGGATTGAASNLNVGNIALSGAGAGLEEIIKTIDEANSGLKAILVSDPYSIIEAEFIDEVKVTPEEEKGILPLI
jgi:hypothetical protein